MLIPPFAIEHREHLVRRFSGADWMNPVPGRIRETRGQRYGLFRRFYRGVTDDIDQRGGESQPRRHAVVLPPRYA